MQTEQSKLLSDIRYIRQMMEMSSEHKLLPDRAAVGGGALVLASSAVTWSLTGSGDVQQVLYLPPLQKLLVTAVWAATGTVSVFLYWFLAAEQSRRLGVSLDARPTRLARQAMGPAVLAAAVLTLRLVFDRHYDLVPAVWMLTYGIGLYNAGLFSSEEPRLLGLLFLVTGIVALLALPGWGLWMTALSFGGYHIAFGAYVLSRGRSGGR